MRHRGPSTVEHPSRAGLLAVLREPMDPAADLSTGERIFRGLFEAAPDAVVITDEFGRIVLFNAEAERLFGYERAELLGESIEVLLPERFRKPHAIRRRRYAAAPRTRQMGVGLALYARRSDGGEFPVDISLSPLRTPAGMLVISAIRDVTERKRAEDALRRSEERYRLLFESANDLVFSVSRCETLTSVNPAAERILGGGTEQLLRRRLADLVSPQDRELVDLQLARTLAGPEPPPTFEVAFLTADGNPIPLELSLRPMLKDGAVVGALGIGRDISERRRLEARLLHGHKMEAVGRLAGGIAHDFNNVLTAIMGYSNLLLARLPVEEPSRAEIAEIRKAADRAGRLVRQLLTFSRTQVVESRLIDPNAVVREMEKMLERLISEHITIRTVLEPGIGPIRADPSQLEQVIVNLAVNARDAMPDGGTLTIATARSELGNEVGGDPTLRPGRYVVLTVVDTGEGMDEATLAHVFEPFFTTKARGEGVGLGLATVYAVVTQSGGQITVESRPRQGTTFTIHLPEAEGEAVPEQVDDGSRGATGSETILFVEDDELLRPLVRTLLEESGYTALEAADTRDALEIVRTHPAPIHLLLTDVVMPRLSGPQLATACVHKRPGLRVLYMSGYAEGEIAEQGVLDPGIDYLPKPFTDVELGRKIREVLERPSQTLGSRPQSRRRRRA